MTVMLLGGVIAEARTLGDEEAEALLIRTLWKARGVAAPRDVANLLLHLAEVHERRGNLPRAQSRVLEAVRTLGESCGLDAVETRHAELEWIRLAEKQGQLAGALAVMEALVARSPASSDQDLALERLRRALGRDADADRALDAAVGSARVEIARDPCTHAPSVIRLAPRLAARGRHEEARALLDEALVELDRVIAGARISISARVRADVRSELAAALAALDR
jgi:tetratricopeptide (TPR) repeat protein